MRRSNGWFRKKHKIKREYDAKLRNLLHETREDWERTKAIEKGADDMNEEVCIRRKIAESTHFYLYKEAKIRDLRNE